MNDNEQLIDEAGITGKTIERAIFTSQSSTMCLIFTDDTFCIIGYYWGYVGMEQQKEDLELWIEANDETI